MTEISKIYEKIIYFIGWYSTAKILDTQLELDVVCRGLRNTYHTFTSLQYAVRFRFCHCHSLHKI